MRLTCYYLALHPPVPETIRGLEEELAGLGRVEVIDQDCELSDAAGRCVDAATPYTLVVSDNVRIAPGTVRKMLRHFRLRRAVQRNLYKLACTVTCPLTENAYPGLVSLYWTDAITQIGTVDVPTAPMPTEYRALIFGYRATRFAEPVGWIEDDDSRDQYHRWFWARVRYRLGIHDHPVPSVTEHVLLYERDGNAQHLYAAAGIADADELRPKVDLVEDRYLGPIGRKLAFDLTRDAQLLAQHLNVTVPLPTSAEYRRAA